MLQAFGVTDRGRVRPTNEDCYAVDESLGLLLVADGMGGHNAGEVAARVAVDAVLEFVRQSAGRGLSAADTWPYGFDPALSDTGNMIRTAIHMANGRVLEAAMRNPEYFGMGTTLVVAMVANGRLSVGHVGDSRAYLARRREVTQLTQDDSWVVSMMKQDPTLDPASFTHHPMRNALTNVVGGNSGADVHVGEHLVDAGDVVVITTDGVHGSLSPAVFATMVLRTPQLADLPAHLVSEAMAHGSLDNCTAVVATVVAP